MILRFYDVSTGPTQPWCSTSQEQQPAGSRHPESRSLEVTMPRPMAVRCCAVSSQGLAATLSCAAGFALCDAHCGCSGGVGSMVRVWGAMAPARFVLFLLLMAMCFRETCAAPWRAPGAGGWAEMGHGLSSSGGKKSGCVPTALCHTSLGLAFHGGWCWAGGDGQHRRSRARARGSAAPQGWLQPCRAMALLLAGWSTAFVVGDVLGRAWQMCAGRSVSISAPGSWYSP